MISNALDQDRENLRKIIAEYSYKEAASEAEAFTLVSGKRSLYYFDLKQTLYRPEGFRLAGIAVWSFLVQANLVGKIQGVGGLTLGADPILFATCQAAWGDNHLLYPLVVRKQGKEHGTKKRVEGSISSCTKVLVVDDVITTGASTMQAIEALRESGVEVVQALALVDRLEGGREAIEALGVPMASVFSLDDFRS